MSTAQKLIKYLAIAFALFLSISIISGILFAIYSLGNVLGLTDDDFITENLEVISGEVTNVSSLDIDLGFTSMQIKEGEKFKVETNNSKIYLKENNGNIEIKEKNVNWLSNMNNNKSSLIIYIPENTKTLENVKIESGAGTVYIDGINSKTLDLELGAGKLEVKNIKISEAMNLDGGAGKIELTSSEIRNLDAELGAGEFIFDGILTGNNEMDSGVGAVKINLKDNVDNYTFSVSKGVGSINLDGRPLEDNKKYGNGNNNIKIDGGVGSIEIKTH